MRAGDLRHRLTIQAPGINRNAYGEEVTVWTDVDTVWGAVWPLRGSEYYSAQQVQASVTHKVRIRFRRNTSPKWRLKFGNRYLYITDIINPDERNIHLDLMCTEEL